MKMMRSVSFAGSVLSTGVGGVNIAVGSVVDFDEKVGELTVEDHLGDHAKHFEPVEPVEEKE